MTDNNTSGKLAPKLSLRVPRHGRGKLLTGGVPGHKGSGGRPKEVLRGLLREQLLDLLPKLETWLAEGKIRHEWYADFLARYGLGTQHEDDITVREPVFTPAERAQRVLMLVDRAKRRARQEESPA